MAYTFSPQLEEKYQWLLTRYPKKDAVLLPLLHGVQEEHGWLSPESIDYVSSRMDLSPARIREVASFYSMFRLDKKGKYVLQVCQTMSCYLRGAEDVIDRIKEVLGIKEGETTGDGMFSLERVECLASCGTAPVMQVNRGDFMEELTIEKVDQILALLKQGKCSSDSYEKRIQEGGVA